MSVPNPGLPPAVLRCFLVEDSAMIRMNLVATLEEMVDIEVAAFAEDEASAVAWLSNPAHACDLAIVDIFLKAGSGVEVLRRARALRPELRLIVLSNFAKPEVRSHYLAVGAERVFDKSSELDEMLAYCAELAAGPGR